MDPYASIGKRYLGALIDYIVYWCVFAGYVILFGESDGDRSFAVHGLKALPLFAWWFIYFPIVEGMTDRPLVKK